MENSLKLLVAGIGRNRYAFRDEDVQSLHEIQRVHRIPFASSTFAGISSIDGAMTRLFDLPACLGHEPLNGNGERQALTLSRGSGKDAFLVGGGMARIEVRAESLLPMPRHLTSPVLEYCVLHSRRLMPVVNLVNLYRRLLEGQWAPPAFSLPKTFHKDRSSSGSAGKGVMVLKVGGETFAVPGNLAAHKAVRLPRLVDMPLAPPYAPGIVHREGKVWTVLDPAVRLNIHQESDRPLFLPLEGKSFGLMVHGSRGRLKAEGFNLQPLPSPFKSDLLNSIVVSKDEIVPLLETDFLPTDRAVEFAEIKYQTTSKFRAQFGKKPIRILIFELEGQRFGIPASQVEAEAAALPFRSLPSSRPIAVGVTQKDAMVLPVLDLARCFGEQSRVGPGWRMIQLKNGNFRGLLLAVRVLGEVSLPPENQIKLPTRLSSMFVHGCFLQDEALRLILDIEALVTHFKHDQPADSFRYLTMRKWKKEDLFHPGLTVNMESPLSADGMPEEETSGADSLVGEHPHRHSSAGAHPDQHSSTVADEKEPEDKLEVTIYPVSAERSLTVEEESTKTTPQTDPRPEGEHETDQGKIWVGEQASDRAEDEKEHNGNTRTPNEDDLSESPVTKSAERHLPSPEPGQDLHQEDHSGPESPEPAPTDEAETLLPEGFSREPGPPPTDKKSETSLKGGLLSVGSEQVRIPPFKQDTYRLRDREGMEAETSKADRAVGLSGRRRSKAGWLVLLAFLLLVVSGSLFAFRLFQWPTERLAADHEQSVVVEPSDTAGERGSGSYEIRENSPDVVEPKMFIVGDTPSIPPRPANVSYPKETSVDGQRGDNYRAVDPAELAAVDEISNEKGIAVDMPILKASRIESRPSRKAAPSLIMEIKPWEGIVSVKSISEIPDGGKLPAGALIHVVERGDTLWHIAERYTGNPFNYPSLASASGIENPDLIFPGQKIAILIIRADD